MTPVQLLHELEEYKQMKKAKGGCRNKRPSTGHVKRLNYRDKKQVADFKTAKQVVT